jgi:hypothetical protein
MNRKSGDGRSLTDERTEIIASGNYTATSSKVAGKTTLYEIGGNATNYASSISGSEYLQIHIGGNFDNYAQEQPYDALYGRRVSYLSSNICGGTGEGHNGVGLLLEVGAKTRFVASNIISVGSNIILAKGGFEATELSNKYLDYKRVDEPNDIGDSYEHTTFKTEVARSCIYSLTGKNTILSEHGPIHTVVSAKRTPFFN